MNKNYWQNLSGSQRGWRIGFVSGIIFIFGFALIMASEKGMFGCHNGFVSCFEGWFLVSLVPGIPLTIILALLGAAIGHFFKKKEASQEKENSPE